MNNAICLLCFRIREKWCMFLNKFKNYSIYVVIDDNSQYIVEFIKMYKNIKFVKINDFLCINSGFYNSVNEVWPESKFKVISWDKAFYYLCNLNKRYSNIWFMEDDIFFYNEKTLFDIDSKNKNSDLIIKKFDPKNNKYDINKWHWKKLMKFKNDNWKRIATYTMVCCFRLSNKYLNILNNYVKRNKKLHFIETLIPTLAIFHKLNINYNKNLQIHWRKKFKEINKFCIYHSFKNLNIQYDLREKLKYNNPLYINEKY